MVENINYFSNYMGVWLISDSHFSSRRKEDTNKILKNWKYLVHSKDLIIHLGDLCWARDINKYLKDLPGHKWLVLGNHDYKLPIKDLNNYFERIFYNGIYDFTTGKTYILKNKKGRLRVFSGFIMPIKGIKILFSHYPAWPHTNKKSYIQQEIYQLFHDLNLDLNIHGHLHLKTIPCSYCINVSVESIDFRPVSLYSLI